MKFKKFLVLQISVLLLFSATAVWGSQIATLADLEQNKKQKQYKSKEEYIKIIERKLVGEGFLEAQKRRKQEVERKIKQKIKENQVIQSVKLAEKEAIDEIHNNLINPSYDATEARKKIAAAREVILDKEKQIREEVEKSIPKVKPKGLEKDIRDFLKEQDRKWAKIPQQMEEINRRGNEALCKDRKNSGATNLKTGCFVLLAGAATYLCNRIETLENDLKESKKKNIQQKKKS